MQERLTEDNWEYGVRMQIHWGDGDGVNLREYANMGCDRHVLKQIRRAKLESIDLDAYVREGFDGEQLREMRVAEKQGVDLVPYLAAGFCGAQLRQVRKGLQARVDVSVYNDIRYNWLQMRELRLGLQSKVDVSKYANAHYSHAQMHEIRLGLEDGLDVKSYADLIYSCMDMRNQRERLTEELYDSGIQLPDLQIVDEATNARIILTNNRREALLALPREQRRVSFTVDYVEELLKRNGIIYGINREWIEQALQHEMIPQPFLAARGIEPEVGPDGRYEFYFNTEMSRKPMELEDGKVDYQHVDLFEEVRQGQVLAKYIPAQRGTPGMCVRGIQRPGIKGTEQPPLEGQGFHLMEDGLSCAASVAGLVAYDDGNLNVSEQLVIQENVTASYGDIQFHGLVHIYGDVGSNVTIHAQGGVIIEGSVEAVNIVSGSDVLLKKGMAGAGKGNIHAHGNIVGNFFEAATLRADKNVEAGYLMNCDTIATGKVVMAGRRSSIIGGRTIGVYGVEASSIGNRTEIATEIATGANQRMLERLRECREQYEQAKVNLTRITNRMAGYSSKDKGSAFYQKMLSEQTVYEEQCKTLLKECEKAEAVLRAKCSVNATSVAYAGTTITINLTTKHLSDDYRVTTFVLQDGEIVSQ